MGKRIFFFLLGFGLMVVGFTYIILYLNLLNIGYNFNQYVNFIIRRFECYYSLIGLLIIIITLFVKGERYNEIYIWYSFKF